MTSSGVPVGDTTPREIVATVRSVREATVRVDVDKHIGCYAKERAEFTGTDEEFVKESLDIIGVYDLLNTDGEDLDDGLTISEEHDEDEIDVWPMKAAPFVGEATQ